MFLRLLWISKISVTIFFPYWNKNLDIQDHLLTSAEIIDLFGHFVRRRRPGEDVWLLYSTHLIRWWVCVRADLKRDDEEERYAHPHFTFTTHPPHDDEASGAGSQTVIWQWCHFKKVLQAVYSTKQKIAFSLFANGVGLVATVQHCLRRFMRWSGQLCFVFRKTELGEEWRGSSPVGGRWKRWSFRRDWFVFYSVR